MAMVVTAVQHVPVAVHGGMARALLRKRAHTTLRAHQDKCADQTEHTGFCRPIHPKLPPSVLAWMPSINVRALAGFTGYMLSALGSAKNVSGCATDWASAAFAR